MKIDVKIKCFDCSEEQETTGKIICDKCNSLRYEILEDIRTENRDLCRENEKLEERKKAIINGLNNLFIENCKHHDVYQDENIPFVWQDCDECILREIQWRDSGTIIRDLCFAIWHGNEVFDNKAVGILEI